MLQTKRRMVPSRFPGGVARGTSFTGAEATTVASDFAIMGLQTTQSEGHPFRRNNRPSGDVGGEFFTSRSYVKGLNRQTHARWVEREEGPGGPNSKAAVDFNGAYFPIAVAANSGTMLPSPTFSPNSDLDKAGATAIANCKPTNSVADATTFLGEILKDGLPHLVGHTLWKDKAKLSRDAGSEFLNVEFGWLPMIHDIRSFAYGVTHADTVLRQYERDAGRQVRRSFRFPIQRTITETEYEGPNSGFGWLNPPSSSLLFSMGQGRTVETRETIRDRWFSGAFTYQMPTGMTSRGQMGKYALYAKQILGLEITPEKLWNLAPWSWAVDWFSNTGDVVSNLSDWSNDGLVMRYGYMMETTIAKVTYSWKMTNPVKGKPSPTPLEFVTVTKVRRGANPFGFGVTWDGLSPLQAAIAAALGLSRR